MNPNKSQNRINTFLEHCYSLDYKERPVSMQEFLSSDRFLGKLTSQGKMVYPVWRDVLKIVSEEDSKYIVVLTGAIGCLGPEVQVSLLDGRELTIPEIIEERKQGKQHWVYSYDINENKLVPGKVVNALLSGNNVGNIVEVLLDNNEKILCTHNHPFLLKSGEYKEAQYLCFGDSLMPLYREILSHGYEISGAGSVKWKSTFRWVAENIFGDIPKNYVVHHIDINKNNNNPDNLKIMISEEHLEYHSKLGNPFSLDKDFAVDCVKKACEIRWSGDNGIEQRKQASVRMTKRNENGLAKKASNIRWNTGDVKLKKKIVGDQTRERNNAGGAQKASLVRWDKEDSHDKHILFMKDWWKKVKTGEIKGHKDDCKCFVCKSKKFKNHKVVSVRFINQKLDVYDLSVEKYHNFALTSGVFVHNTGKTRTAIVGLLYLMYKILCLKNPWNFFQKTAGGKFAIVFFNLTKSLGQSKGYNLLQGYLRKSEWFLERGHLIGNKDEGHVEFPIFDYKLASPYSQGFGVVGEDVIGALLDEVDSPTESEGQRMRVLKAFEAALRRFESRFVFDFESIGRIWLVSSKQEQMSFLNTFIAQMKNTKNVYIKDIALWDAKPATDYCGDKFTVVLGDIYTSSKIENSPEEVLKAVQNGRQIVKVPVEYKELFQRDIVGGLRDLAGISATSLRKSKLFSSEKMLFDCYDSNKKNPVSMLTINIGLQDDIDLINYLDFSCICVSKSIPRYIHVDIAFSGEGDALGLGMSSISGWTERNILQRDGTFKLDKLPVLETDFGMRIKARPGDQIPLHKIRKFILDLKQMYGYNIVLCTFDLKLASADTQQILTAAGIKCDDYSLDKSPDGYRDFRNIVSEKRWICHFNPYLHFELVNLEDDKVKNKIDHPENVVDLEVLKNGETQEIVVKGSKDISDGVVGSVIQACKNSEVPVDAEVMKDLMKKALTPSTGIGEFADKYWFVDRKDLIKGNVKKESVKQPDGITEKYKDILRRARG